MILNPRNLWQLSRNLFQIGQHGTLVTFLRNPACIQPRMAKCLAFSQFRTLTASAKTSEIAAKQAENSASTGQQDNDQREDDILYKSIQLEASSADKAVLDSYERFVTMAANFLEIPVGRIWEPYRHIKRRTLLRAAFVKKKYRVQYEFRTYFRSIELKYLTGSTADTFLEYIERNLPEGTSLKVIRTRIEKLPEHLKPPQEEK